MLCKAFWQNSVRDFIIHRDYFTGISKCCLFLSQKSFSSYICRGDRVFKLFASWPKDSRFESRFHIGLVKLDTERHILSAPSSKYQGKNENKKITGCHTGSSLSSNPIQRYSRSSCIRKKKYHISNLFSTARLMDTEATLSQIACIFGNIKFHISPNPNPDPSADAAQIQPRLWWNTTICEIVYCIGLYSVACLLNISL